MSMKALVTTAVEAARAASIQRVTLWFREKGKNGALKFLLCLVVSMLLALGGPVHIDVTENRHGRGESLIIPATYDPIAVPVRITAYNPVKGQTDETPFTMASGKTVYTGAIALSRDLETDFGLKFGDPIEIEGLGLFVFEDRMHWRWKRRVDILLFSREKARRFGVRYGFLRIH